MVCNSAGLNYFKHLFFKGFYLGDFNLNILRVTNTNCLISIPLLVIS